jgi:hypothetical protein
VPSSLTVDTCFRELLELGKNNGVNGFMLI